MNTPAHLIVNLAVISRGRWQACGLVVLAGAFVPDAPMIVFYAYQKLVVGTGESQIWNSVYYQPGWQLTFDLFNSIPLIIVLALVAAYIRLTCLVAFALSMLLHCLLDLPLHHDDGHRHFFPFSDWRFESPVSYWDTRHYGQVFLVVEGIAVIVAATVVWRAHRDRMMRALAIVVPGSYAAFLGYAFVVWGG